MLARYLAIDRDRARELHKNQRYGHMPYTFHLDAVLSVALEFYITDEDILRATRYHDAIEDTEAVFEDIQAWAGTRVAELAWAVTLEDGKNRREKFQAAAPKIVATRGATILKLCDRVANVRNCWQELADQDANKRNKSKLGMYRKEYPMFRKALYNTDPDYTETEMALWAELDRLLAWNP